ncbi:unnamed protein product [Gongylonema pulchrum]|uniref:RNase H domain-containing protein n=1 Tax=Gongylonema pulchrum TaxID=637853 RepID=A0A183CWP7_9BILA|nr:unnamed protein product [Gongylonema pulchrum]
MARIKARQCPIKGARIPQLELLAGLIGVRVQNFVKNERNMNDAVSCVYSDSKCVLHWINSTKANNSKFVQNHPDEIRATEIISKYFPTKD